MVHRRHFGETGYVTRMLTILNPAHIMMLCHVSENAFISLDYPQQFSNVIPKILQLFLRFRKVSQILDGTLESANRAYMVSNARDE